MHFSQKSRDNLNPSMKKCKIVGYKLNFSNTSVQNTYLQYQDAPLEMDLSPCEEPGHKGQEFLWTKVPKAQPSELKLHSVTMKYVFFCQSKEKKNMHRGACFWIRFGFSLGKC